MQTFLRDYKDYFYFVFRVLTGLLFFAHGLQKLFGLLGGQAMEMYTLFWFAGLIEVVVGAMVILGLWTSWAAFLGAVEMVAAYFIVHIPKGLNPLSNQGELAILYFVAFLVMMTHGSKKWGITED